MIKDESRVDELLKALDRLEDEEVEIGIFGDALKDSSGQLTILGKATVNEYGTGTIPERSFIRSSFDKNVDKISESVGNLVDDVMKDNITADEMFAIIGENGTRMIRKHIQDGVAPPNHPETLKRKKGTTPLIDTGEMISNLDWQINKRK